MGDIYKLGPEAIQAPSMEQIAVNDRLSIINAAEIDLTVAVTGAKHASYSSAA